MTIRKTLRRLEKELYLGLYIVSSMAKSIRDTTHKSPNFEEAKESMILVGHHREIVMGKLTEYQEKHGHSPSPILYKNYMDSCKYILDKLEGIVRKNMQLNPIRILN